MTTRPRDACPDAANHTVDPTEPSDYLAWHEWADWMTQHSKQEQCPTCGLWAIWSPTGEQLGYPGGPVCLGVTGRRGGKASHR